MLTKWAALLIPLVLLSFSQAFSADAEANIYPYGMEECPRGYWGGTGCRGALENVIDGDYSTYWYPASSKAAVKIDFGQAVEGSYNLTYKWRGDDNSPDCMGIIRISSDDTDYTTIVNEAMEINWSHPGEPAIEQTYHGDTPFRYIIAEIGSAAGDSCGWVFFNDINLEQEEQPEPDLIIDNITIEESSLEGVPTYHYKVHVKNQGDLGAQESKLSVTVSPQQPQPDDDSYACHSGFSTWPDLAEGEISIYGKHVSPALESDITITATIDSEGEVTESDEDNNAMSRVFHLEPVIETAQCPNLCDQGLCAVPVCSDGDSRECGNNEGECSSVTYCSDGQWGQCMVFKGPQEEVCDQKDNDCDGLIDEEGVCTESYCGDGMCNSVLLHIKEGGEKEFILDGHSHAASVTDVFLMADSTLSATLSIDGSEINDASTGQSGEVGGMEYSVKEIFSNPVHAKVAIGKQPYFVISEGEPTVQNGADITPGDYLGHGELPGSAGLSQLTEEELPAILANNSLLDLPLQQLIVSDIFSDSQQSCEGCNPPENVDIKVYLSTNSRYRGINNEYSSPTGYFGMFDNFLFGEYDYFSGYLENIDPGEPLVAVMKGYMGAGTSFSSDIEFKYKESPDGSLRDFKVCLPALSETGWGGDVYKVLYVANDGSTYYDKAFNYPAELCDTENFEYNYDQYIFIGKRAIEYSSSGEDELLGGSKTVLWDAGTSSDKSLYMLRLDFDNPVDFSDSMFHGKSMRIFGRDAMITNMSNNQKLALLLDHQSVTLNEGETDTISEEGNDYDATLVVVTQSDTAIVNVGGIQKEITENDLKQFAGIQVYLKNADLNGTGPAFAELVFGSTMLTLEDEEEPVSGSGSDTERIDNCLTEFFNDYDTGFVRRILVRVAAQDRDGDFVADGMPFIDPVFGSFRTVLSDFTNYDEWRGEEQGRGVSLIFGETESKCPDDCSGSIECYSDSDCGSKIEDRYCSGDLACRNLTAHHCSYAGTEDSACSIIRGHSCTPCINGCLDGFCIPLTGECSAGDARECGTDTGACEKGIQVCIGGSWSSCSGASMPGDEICGNDIDDDCDGNPDDGCPTRKLEPNVWIDEDITYQGERLFITATVKNDSGLPMEGASLTAVIRDPLGNTVEEYTESSDKNGMWTFILNVGSVTPGEYSVTLEAGHTDFDEGSDTKSFLVRESLTGPDGSDDITIVNMANVVIKMETIGLSLGEISKAVDSIINYYNVTGDIETMNTWVEISGMIDNAIGNTTDIQSEIRLFVADPSDDKIADIKSGIESLSEYLELVIEEIVVVVVGALPCEEADWEFSEWEPECTQECGVCTQTRQATKLNDCEGGYEPSASELERETDIGSCPDETCSPSGSSFCRGYTSTCVTIDGQTCSYMPDTDPGADTAGVYERYFCRGNECVDGTCQPAGEQRTEYRLTEDCSGSACMNNECLSVNYCNCGGGGGV